MNPQAVTVGARLGRRLNENLILPAAAAGEPVAFFGGLLASIIGGAAGKLGPQTAAELLRGLLARLDGQPQLELPPGVRLAIAAAEEEPPAAANDAPESPQPRLRAAIAHLIEDGAGEIASHFDACRELELRSACNGLAVQIVQEVQRQSAPA